MASRAHVVLEAVKLSINAEIAQLHQLISQHPTLKLELFLRILLTYLPETLEPQSCQGLLSYLSERHADQHTYTSEVGTTFPDDRLQDANARERVKRLHLLPLLPPHQRELEGDIVYADPFTQFLIRRAVKIETETGSLPLVAQLVEPFLSHSDYLRTWAVSSLLPLLRLGYQYYVNEGPTYSLETFENLSGASAVEGLLSKAAEKKDDNSGREIARDLRGLVGPRAYGQRPSKRRRLDSVTKRRSSVADPRPVDEEPRVSRKMNGKTWATVYDWLLNLSMRDYSRAVGTVSHWGGPQDVDYGSWEGEDLEAEEDSLLNHTSRYAQTGLAMIYANNAASMSVVQGSHDVLQRSAQLVKLATLPDLSIPNSTLTQEITKDYLDSLSPTQLLQNALLRSQNPLTTPGKMSFSLCHLLLSSNYILHSFGETKACRSLLDLAVFGSETDQVTELHRLLHGLAARTQDERSWQANRYKILWLQNWGYQVDVQYSDTSQERRGIFSKVAMYTVENEMLKAMLSGTNYDLVASIYCKQDDSPLPLTVVEKTIMDVALASYDSASNGNRTRGGVRKASEIVNVFRTFFPTSEAFSNISALLKATHAMSFYSLTLQHGVPFQPVNIRAHRDPMLLVGKILQQNPGSYTKLDDLLDIGQDLVSAGLNVAIAESESVSNSERVVGQQALIAKRRIIGMAIEAALREDDFDTAYSYVVNRLPQNANSHSKDACQSSDDISWRAAYKAGCYIPTKASGPSSLRRLEQRMELLSQALLLAPPSVLADILEVWRHCEEDLNVVLTQEAEAEEKWNDRGDRKMPGQFTGDSSPVAQKSRESSRAAMNEDAPMGLFDVARGAAATLGKSAFPLRSPRNPASTGPLQTVHEKSLSKMSAGGSDSGSGGDVEGRVRKRDMVSNMVTGGLASGIGWVLGAPPVRESE